MSVTFSQDPQVGAALRHWWTKRVWTTDLGSADLRGLSRDLHRRSILSARTTSAEYLNEVDAAIQEMLAGKTNLATTRLRLMRKLKQLGYDPERGFPEDMATVPPADRGSLQDLSSQQRIDLMVRTQVAMARNYGRMLAGNTEQARFSFPAYELVRLGERHTPRGFRRVREQLVADPSNAWQRRWTQAATEVDNEGVAQPHSVGMIARKDSPIWQALGDGAGGHHDTLGNPYPPFAFNSGMDWRAVPRAECLALGLIEGASAPAPMRGSLAPSPSQALETFRRLSPDLRAVLAERWAA